jgi:hypothetical protein
MATKATKEQQQTLQEDQAGTTANKKQARFGNQQPAKARTKNQQPTRGREEKAREEESKKSDFGECRKDAILHDEASFMVQDRMRLYIKDSTIRICSWNFDRLALSFLLELTGMHTE